MTGRPSSPSQQSNSTHRQPLSNTWQIQTSHAANNHNSDYINSTVVVVVVVVVDEGLVGWHGCPRVRRDISTAFPGSFVMPLTAEADSVDFSSLLSYYYFFNFFRPSVLNSRGYKILKTKQVRPQWRLLGGESAVEGDRISPLKNHRLLLVLEDHFTPLTSVYLLVKLSRI